jgi:hypothetical protein
MVVREGGDRASEDIRLRFRGKRSRRHSVANVAQPDPARAQSKNSDRKTLDRMVRRFPVQVMTGCDGSDLGAANERFP